MDGSRVPGDTLFRQWLMLLRVPKDPAKRSTTEITNYLRSEGYEVTSRTVQRDLEKLSSQFSYTCLTEGRTNYWYFPQEQKVLEIPGMNSATALVLLLAQDNAQSMIPPATLELLKPYFSRAEDVLAQAIPRPLAQWRKRIKVIERGPTLRPASVNKEVQTVVYEAILNQRQICVHYRGRKADSKNEQVLHPVGIVLREGVIYLVATAWDYSDVRHYALHRMSLAVLLSEPANYPKGFDLDAYIEKEFRYPATPSRFKMILKMEKSAAFHLRERPLSSDQLVVDCDGGVEISATVDDTEVLRWWILGFGRNVEVLKPIRLRREIGAQIKDLAERYHR